MNYISVLYYQPFSFTKCWFPLQQMGENSQLAFRDVLDIIHQSSIRLQDALKPPQNDDGGSEHQQAAAAQAKAAVYRLGRRREI